MKIHAVQGERLLGERSQVSPTPHRAHRRFKVKNGADGGSRQSAAGHPALPVPGHPRSLTRDGK